MQSFLAPLASINIALVFGLTGMGIGLVFGLVAMYLGHRRRVLWHETARLALEKGQPLPPPIPDVAADNPLHNLAMQAAERELAASQSPGRRCRGFIMGGLINLAVAAGLYLALSQVSPPAANFAAIPGFIGIAFLGMAVVEYLFRHN